MNVFRLPGLKRPNYYNNLGMNGIKMPTRKLLKNSPENKSKLHNSNKSRKSSGSKRKTISKKSSKSAGVNSLSEYKSAQSSPVKTISVSIKNEIKSLEYTLREVHTLLNGIAKDTLIYGKLLHLNKNPEWVRLISEWNRKTLNLDKTVDWKSEINKHGDNLLWKNRKETPIAPINWEDEIDWDIISANENAGELITRSKYQRKINFNIVANNKGMIEKYGNIRKTANKWRKQLV